MTLCQKEGKLGGNGVDSLMSKEESARLLESLNQNWPTDGFADTQVWVCLSIPAALSILAGSTLWEEQP